MPQGAAQYHDKPAERPEQQMSRFMETQINGVPERPGDFVGFEIHADKADAPDQEHQVQGDASPIGKPVVTGLHIYKVSPCLVCHLQVLLEGWRGHGRVVLSWIMLEEVQLSSCLARNYRNENNRPRLTSPACRGTWGCPDPCGPRAGTHW